MWHGQNLWGAFFGGREKELMAMSRFTRVAGTVVVVSLLAWSAMPVQAATYEVTYDFNTAWAGDYTPGWENTAYRHGPSRWGR